MNQSGQSGKCAACSSASDRARRNTLLMGRRRKRSHDFVESVPFSLMSLDLWTMWLVIENKGTVGLLHDHLHRLSILDTLSTVDSIRVRDARILAILSAI